jgi:hypothetical protein
MVTNMKTTIPTEPVSTYDPELLDMLADIRGLRRIGTATLLEEREYHERELGRAWALPTSDDGRDQLIAYYRQSLQQVEAELARRERWEAAVRHPAPRRFDQQFARDLKERVDLRLLIANDVQLRKASASRAVGLCPFHVERTPSFTVWAIGFRCYGCQVGGDHYTWLMRDGADFPTAVQRLGAFAGVRMPGARSTS